MLNQIITFIFIIIIGLLFLAVTMNAVRVESWSGCAIDSCPQGIQDWYYKNHLMYYTKYKYGNKNYWRSYCNSFIGTDFECK